LKKLIALVAIFVLASFLAGALFSRLSVQPANTQDQFSGGYGNAQPTDAAQNQGASGLDGAATGTQSAQSTPPGSPIPSPTQTGVPEDDSWLRYGCNPDTPIANGVPPPDGAIFYGGEPPYAYIPTYNPKETGLPILPLEPES
jgi:hypothetical protein